MLYSYKMTADRGFAPNPFHGILSLATCKPQIRESKKVGMYIAGFTSSKLCGDAVGQERMVYIMKISEKITFDEYFNSERFKCKIASNKNRIAKVGDNIYYLSEGSYKQGMTYFHRKDKEIAKDLKSKNVLLSTDFFYFGVGAIPVDKFKITIPKYQSGQGVRTEDEKAIKELWNHLEACYKKNQVLHPPHSWDDNEPFNIKTASCS